MTAMAFPIALDRELVTRIQMEFIEMPGLRVSERQACRLWNLDEATGVQILALLVEKRFLTRSREGAYLRTGSSRRHQTDAA